VATPPPDSGCRHDGQNVAPGGVVLPHEETFPKHKEDRYRLLTAAGAQFSPIFGLYSAPGEGVRERLASAAAAAPAAAAVDDEGVEHRLWRVVDPAFAAWAAALLEPRPVFIADGHHRYETALRLRTERRAAAPAAPPGASDHVMAFLVEMDDPGLVLLPTHRMVTGGLPPAGELVERCPADGQPDRVPQRPDQARGAELDARSAGGDG